MSSYVNVCSSCFELVARGDVELPFRHVLRPAQTQLADAAAGRPCQLCTPHPVQRKPVPLPWTGLPLGACDDY